jgi:hypothetical protein
MQSKDDDQNLDNSEFQISIFILLIMFHHSTCNACPIHPHKIKRVAPLLQATRSRWQNHAQQMIFRDLMRVSVPTKDGSQQSSIFTHIHQGPVSKYPLMLILSINNKINTRHPNSFNKIHQQ